MVCVAVRSSAPSESRSFPAKKGGIPAVTKVVSMEEESCDVECVTVISGGKTEEDTPPESLNDVGECYTAKTKKMKEIFKIHLRKVGILNKNLPQIGKGMVWLFADS